MKSVEHYLKKELFELFQQDTSLFEFLQQGSLDGVWYWDLENPENEWMSPRFWTLLGFDPEEKEHLASEWQDLINQDDLKVALDNFNKHCAIQNIHMIKKFDTIIKMDLLSGCVVAGL